MTAGLLVAAALAFLVGLAHSYLGERYILIRLFRRRDLPKLFGDDLFTRRTLRFAWHVTSIAWWGFGALLVLLARGATARELLLAIAATFAAIGATALVGSRGRHLAWIVFLAIATLSALGASAGGGP